MKMKIWNIFAFISLFYSVHHASSNSLSVLMIVIDDLRANIINPETGRNMLKTPNIDKLAKRGVRFNQAYAQYAMCSPSRSSLLTGTRPDTTSVYDLVTHFRDNIPMVVTLPQAFKNQGYHCYGIGKIFHRGYGDDDYSWSLPQPSVDQPAYCDPINIQIDKQRKDESHKEGVLRGGKVRRGPAIEKSSSNCSFHDNVVADEAIRTLRKISKDYALHSKEETNQPFFLSVGFIRPHLPWVAPIQHWDDQNKISDFDFKAQKLKIQGLKRLPGYVLQGGSHELASYYGIDMISLLHQNISHTANEDITRAEERKDNALLFPSRMLRQGYAASASFADAQVGRVLDELTQLSLDQSTVVLLWSDHGYKLGEHSAWGKNSNTDLDTRVPLIVALPTIHLNHFSDSFGHLLNHSQVFNCYGSKANIHPHIKSKTDECDDDIKHFLSWETDALIELVDVYPTLLDLCGISQQSINSYPLEGSSFLPLLLNKTLAESFNIKKTKNINNKLEKKNKQFIQNHNNKDVLKGIDDDEFFPFIWKRAIFSQVTRKKLIMGYNMRTSRFRVTVWVDTRSLLFKQTQVIEDDDVIEELGEELDQEEKNKEKQGKNKLLEFQLDLSKALKKQKMIDSNRMNLKMIKSIELYDLDLDPEENFNVASKIEYKSIQQKLFKIWSDGYCASSPNIGNYQPTSCTVR